ncbi:MAG: AAA family ATPase [Sulfurimonas sp.]
MKKINLPKLSAEVELEYNQTVVFIGANGSGKSRLGAWIEKKHSKKIHRISAQRNLSFSSETPLKSLAASEKFFYYGNDYAASPGHIEKNPLAAKAQGRWGQGKYTTGLLNDYDHLLTMLYAEQNLRNENLAKKIDISVGSTIDDNFKVSSNIEILVDTWNKLLPHRQIEFSDQKIIVKKGNENYFGTELSDGERVIIYLIGQVLSVEKDNILVVDEPEIHIHKSIVNHLWDELENLRSDVDIFYITHDLDFAKERFGSKKIWVKSFDGAESWEWEEIDFANDEEFNQIHFEVMGSRKPVLFVEGEKGSLDTKVYTKLYPEYTIVPVKSCDSVIEMVSSYKKEWTLHNIAPVGIVDKDFREESDIVALNTKGISVLSVLEIENLFCLPEVAKYVYDLLSSSMHFDKSFDEITGEISAVVVKVLEDDIDKLVLNATHRRIVNSLHRFPQPKHTENLSEKYNEYIATIDAKAIESDIRTIFDEIKTKNDTSEMVCYIDNKGLSAQIAKILGMTKDRYIETVIKNLEDEKLKDIFLHYLPQIIVEGE